MLGKRYLEYWFLIWGPKYGVKVGISEKPYCIPRRQLLRRCPYERFYFTPWLENHPRFDLTFSPLLVDALSSSGCYGKSAEGLRNPEAQTFLIACPGYCNPATTCSGFGVCDPISQSLEFLQCCHKQTKDLPDSGLKRDSFVGCLVCPSNS